MKAVKVLITRYTNEDQPGWVECCLTDAWKNEWYFEEKVPVVSGSHLDAQSSYPRPGAIACNVLRESQDATGRQIITIDTNEPWGVTSSSGTTEFDILPDQLIDIP